MQEVDRNKKRTNNANTIKYLSQVLNMHYAWTAPSPNKKENEEETGVAILSVFPLSDVTHIVLPNEGPGGRRRVAIGATVQINDLNFRFYSLHGETRIDADEKLEQYKAVIEDLDRHYKAIKHAVILGDFNTIFLGEVENVSNLFINKHFNTPFPNNETIWRQYFIKLKLDWIWLRGFTTTEYGINKQIKLSDHFPLWIKVYLTTLNQTDNRERIVPQQEITKTINEKLRRELLEMEKKDQDARKNFNGENINNLKLIKKMSDIDEKNTERLKKFIAKYGWLSSNLVGKDGLKAAFLIVQHSPDWGFQKEMLPFVETSAKRGEISNHNYTLLVDRVRVHFGQTQLYGTQASIKDGKLIVDPIEDEENVDERRKALGLQPLDEYLKILAEIYKLPVEKSQRPKE